MSNTREITVFVKNEKGEKIPQKLILDEEGVLVQAETIKEKVEKTPEEILKEASEKAKKQMDEVNSFLTNNSVEYEEDPVTKVRKLKKAPAEFLEIFKFFSEHTPCWFDGCEELRKEYKKELEDLGSDCLECEKGSLIRKYHKKVKTILDGSKR